MAELLDRARWWVATLVCVALAVAVAWNTPGAFAPVLLSAALPIALATSPALRRSVPFAGWILSAIPIALGLWRFSSGGLSPVLVWPMCAAIGGLVGFVGMVAADPKVGAPLAGLAFLVALVAYFSSGSGGSGPMIDWYERYGLTLAQAEALTLAFRKTVHFTFYGTVAWFALRAARATGAKPIESVQTALLACLAVASFDESRQLGYANRSGSPWDVLLDLAGGLTFVGLSEARRRKER